MKRKTELNPFARLFLFIIGMAGAIILIIYSIRWEALPISFSAMGNDITIIAFAGILVLASIIFYTLIKSAILGEWKLD